MRLAEPSPYTPMTGVAPVEPAWKSAPEFADAVHPRRKVAGEEQAVGRRQSDAGSRPFPISYRPGLGRRRTPDRPSACRALRSCGKRNIHGDRDADGADRAEGHGRDHADERRDRAGAELAQFVGRADEDGVDGADPAAHGVGRPELDQGVADDRR